MSKEPKIDLTLLKKLVSELENTLNVAYDLRAEPSTDSTDFTVEMAKASGLSASITQEATLLIGDIASLVRSNLASDMKKADLLEKILGSRGSGNSN